MSSRSAKAGARNLARWKAANPRATRDETLRHGLFAQLGKYIPDEVRETLDAFEVSLKEQLGGSVSPTELALIHSARVSYTIVLLGQRYLDSQKQEPGSAAERRRRGLMTALAFIGNHQTSLLRTLRALGVQQRRVRSDENLDAEVDDVVAEIKAARG